MEGIGAVGGASLLSGLTGARPSQATSSAAPAPAASPASAASIDPVQLQVQVELERELMAIQNAVLSLLLNTLGSYSAASSIPTGQSVNAVA